jgi:hypothetical protein
MDGFQSSSTGRGTGSHHGGVKWWNLSDGTREYSQKYLSSLTSSIFSSSTSYSSNRSSYSGYNSGYGSYDYSYAN